MAAADPAVAMAQRRFGASVSSSVCRGTLGFGRQPVDLIE
jgi:hypothetical protein